MYLQHAPGEEIVSTAPQVPIHVCLANNLVAGVSDGNGCVEHVHGPVNLHGMVQRVRKKYD
jgi:hypothetical protein